MIKYTILLIVSLLMGLLAAHMAAKRSRNTTAWFFIGLLFGWIGLLVLFFLPPLETQKVVKEPETPHLKKEEPAASEIVVKNWFYLDKAHVQQGPVLLADLEALWLEDKINESTYVWQEGMVNWQRVRELPELFRILTGPKL